ncbi:MAG: hypothetical protein IJ258_03075 [Methanobrevibacter sp.]|uniref:hypothetical protein n=1 Tax=Methanobrevibacter sp. TaxID=66852 RepID=UPI0025F53DC7|nr:hypothetical protein [Methanobrevibacter sp.]MBQ8017068.1 hypothetical protein [Methanobrevibacter sp.]
MSDKETLIGDEMIKAQLIKKSNKLGISLDELIERYIRRGLYGDDYYTQPQLSKKEIDEIFKRNMERDKKNSIPSKRE